MAQIQQQVENLDLDAAHGCATPTALHETTRPIWEIVEEIGASVPKEEWDKVPTDAAQNLRHYLYGHVKNVG